MAFGCAWRVEDQNRAQEKSIKEAEATSGKGFRLAKHKANRPRLPKRVKEMTSKDYMSHMRGQGS